MTGISISPMTTSNGQPIQGGWGESAALSDISQGRAILQRGQSEQSVEEMQSRLAELGYLDSEDVDGKFGPRTEAALRSFQSYNDLEVDGLFGALSYARLMGEGAVASPRSFEPAQVAAAARDTDTVERVQGDQTIAEFAGNWPIAMEDADLRLATARAVAREQSGKLDELRHEIDRIEDPEAREELLGDLEELRERYDSMQEAYIFSDPFRDMVGVSELELALLAAIQEQRQ